MELNMYNKYGNRKTQTPDGEVFDSNKEAKRWTILKLLEGAGEITDLRRQVKYDLIPPQYEGVPKYTKSGQRIKDKLVLVEREVSYIADFVYFDKRLNQTIVEDVKGMKTKEYVIKRKLMLYFHGIRITEV